MAVDRYNPPFQPGTAHFQNMSPSGRGTFMLYKDYMFKVKILKGRIKELEAIIDNKPVIEGPVSAEQAHQNWLNTPGG
jgi:hypothetical protein